jgi:hypothetical protein
MTELMYLRPQGLVSLTERARDTWFRSIRFMPSEDEGKRQHRRTNCRKWQKPGDHISRISANGPICIRMAGSQHSKHNHSEDKR